MKLVIACATLCLCVASARAEHEPRVAFGVEVDDTPPDKKTSWLTDKVAQVTPPNEPPAALSRLPLSLHNEWTDEILPVDPDARDADTEDSFDHLTRCHYTGAWAQMAPALLPLLRRTAAHFRVSTVEIVSGYRAPKYQLTLRKKGHEVARDSEHPRGEAVDFRLPGVPTRQLLAFVRAQRLGGVGFYPDSKFVHADVGPVRYWRGH